VHGSIIIHPIPSSSRATAPPAALPLAPAAVTPQPYEPYPCWPHSGSLPLGGGPCRDAAAPPFHPILDHPSSDGIAALVSQTHHPGQAGSNGRLRRALFRGGRCR
jgi:hypothetical protein